MVPSEDSLIIGVDFGTTFSGIAFTYKLNPESADEITVVKSWPGSNMTAEKVPSEITYGSLLEDFEVVEPQDMHSPEIRWGLQLSKPDEPRLRCLKLRLDPRQKLPSYVSAKELDDQLGKCNKTAEEAISDYLKVLYSHAMDVMTRRFGSHMVSSTNVEIVLTVPAVWTDAAKDATLRAARDAGMGPKLVMISEPEAAATYALKSMDKETKMLGSGDNFIVCDAGGGTVDIISYQICSKSPLRLKESAPGTGALCGGVFLNLRFQDLIKTRMGPRAFSQLRPQSWSVTLRYFEDYVKKNFDPVDPDDEEDEEGTFNVPLAGTPDNVGAGIECGFITLSNADIAEIFRPLVESVISLVDEQCLTLKKSGKAAKGVILVGLFGQSAYLFKCLKTHFSRDESSNLAVMQPANAWTAVVRGAVLSRIQENLVTSRKARRHYGVRCAKLFDPSKHSYKNKYWDIYHEIFRANNQVSWHIKRGVDMPTQEPILLDFTRKWYYNDPIPEVCTYSIIVSDETDAPVEYEFSRETRILCHLTSDLTTLPRHHFEEHVNSQGLRYRSLDYKIGMTIQSGSICFDLRVDGIVYGSVRPDFE